MSSTGLTDGQYVGIKQALHPDVSDAAVTLQVLVNGTVHVTYTSWPNGVMLSSMWAPDDTDADVTVRAYDAAGNTGEATTRVHMDATAPTATFSPPLGSIVHGITTITAPTGSDDIARIVLTGIDGHEIDQATGAPWSLAWDTTGPDKGVSLQVIDRAGNARSYLGGYRVDNAGPTVSLDSGGDGQHIPPGSHYLYARVNDLSGLDHVEWWVDGALRSTDRSLTYDFGSAIRTVPVEIRAWDVWGNPSTTTFPLLIDNDNPTVTSISPPQLSLVRGTSVTSTIQATDQSGVDYAILNGSNPVGPDDDAPFTASMPVGRDGGYTLFWRVGDPWGHETYARRTVVVDNTRPALALTSAPTNGLKISGTFHLAATATDRNGIRRVEMLINGRVVATDTTAAYGFSMNSAIYGSTFTMVLRAYDRAGNVTTTSPRTWHH